MPTINPRRDRQFAKNNLFRLLVLLFIFFASSLPVLFLMSRPLQAEDIACCRKHGFAITLPPGWVSVPQAVLERFSEQLHKLNPKVAPQIYDYGFQRDAANAWFAYPYVLVQVRESGRVGEADLKKLKTSAGIPDFVAMPLGIPVYDSAHNVIWTRTSSEFDRVGRIETLSGTVLTAKGGVMIYCYAKDGEFGSLIDSFRDLVLSVKLEKDLQF